MEQFLPFKEALVHARSWKLEGKAEWEAWTKSSARPANVPSRPHTTYKHEGWQGWGHWLGTGNVPGRKKQQFLPFKEALLHARSLELTGQKEWEAWCKSGARPANIPASPDKTYKPEGWQGWGHWLGTGAVANKNHQFLPFKETLAYARSLKLKGKAEWRNWCKSGKRSVNIPAAPEQVYTHRGWQGYGHWLGTGNSAGGQKVQQGRSRAVPRSGTTPSTDTAYKHDGWIKKKKHQHFLPFKEALVYARSLKLKTQRDWEAWCKSGARPANVASTPSRTYKHDGWQGYGHWLATGAVAKQD